MRVKNVFIISMSGLLGITACAQSKKAGSTASTSKEYVTLIKSSKQMSRDAKPGMEYNFFVRWESNIPPEAFYWKESDNWAPCRITKASKATPGEYWEGSGEVVTENIKKGDTLLLMPLLGGKHPIPVEISTDAINALFYKTVNSAWLSIPVKNIKG
jgi:hypothetical protein